MNSQIRTIIGLYCIINKQNSHANSRKSGRNQRFWFLIKTLTPCWSKAARDIIVLIASKGQTRSCYVIVKVCGWLGALMMCYMIDIWLQIHTIFKTKCIYSFTKIWCAFQLSVTLVQSISTNNIRVLNAALYRCGWSSGYHNPKRS